MKTKRRNQAAVAALFALAVILGGVMGAWLGEWSSFKLNETLVFLIMVLWSVVATTCSIVLYRELEDRRVLLRNRAGTRAYINSQRPW